MFTTRPPVPHQHPGRRCGVFHAAKFGRGNSRSEHLLGGNVHARPRDAKKAGLDGVQIPLGLAGDDLDVANAGVRTDYQEKKRLTGLPIRSFSISPLCPHPLATDRRALRAGSSS